MQLDLLRFAIYLDIAKDSESRLRRWYSHSRVTFETDIHTILDNDIRNLLCKIKALMERKRLSLPTISVRSVGETAYDTPDSMTESDVETYLILSKLEKYLAFFVLFFQGLYGREL